MKRLFEWAFRTRVRQIFSFVIVLLIVVRIAAPFVLLKVVNEKLATYSPTYSLHIGDLSLGIWRGAYRFEAITGDLRKGNDRFLKIDLIDVSIAWRELLRGNVVTDILIDGLDFAFTKELTEAGPAEKEKKTEAAKQETTKAARTLFPVRIERVDIRNSTFQYSEIKALPLGERLRVTSLNGRLSNLTPSEGLPFAMFEANGTLLDMSMIKTVGRLDLLRQPMAWEADIEMRDFDVVKANPILGRMLPLTFTRGSLDLYSELRSEDGRIEGYVKPFLRNAKITGTEGDFKNFRQFFVELATATANLFLREHDNKTVAAKIPFVYDKDGFHLMTATTIGTLLKNGFDGGIPAGLEDNLNLELPKIGSRDYSKNPPEIKAENVTKTPVQKQIQKPGG